MSDRLFIPADPDQRRRLWREWIHTDEPQAANRPIIRPARRAQASNDWLPEAIDAPAAVIHGLKTAIAESLVGGTLPLADRERLIRRSVKLGLSRFEANLLIAAVQNRHREEPASLSEPFPSEPIRLSLGGLLVLALLVESLAGLVIFRFLL